MTRKDTRAPTSEALGCQAELAEEAAVPTAAGWLPAQQRMVPREVAVRNNE